MDKHEITLQISESFVHEHNSKIEHFNRSLEEKLRSLLFSARFPPSFWGLAAECATYLYNRTPHSALNFITPYEMVFNKQPDLSYVRIFSSKTDVFNENLACGDKTASRSSTQYLVGFRDTEYITWDPVKRNTNDVCSVVVHEET